ncbi:NucA/NucB deoxyribonuclease domain-containing protein [Streptomyces sp. HUAS TT7]|uniref:NucA/NucB deoxyribonuclease domain-containing protein n=1 Tax=Streptomyces sp. HUAS TT7 TaxID=3447507 RepID=UPI003F658183
MPGRTRAAVAALVTGALCAALVQSTARADAPPTPPKDAPSASEIPVAQRADVLGGGWRTSADRAWTTTGDAQGFHVLTAEQSSGYAWKTAASLKEPGFDTDAWIGNACVTGSGKRAVVVYAPRTFTNKSQLMARGGFTAIVELDTGKVTKLGLQTSLSYYNPGCGAGETAVLTQSPGEDKQATRLFRLDTQTGKLSPAIQTPGQLTSASPTKDGSIVAAAGAELVKVGSDGGRTTLARTDSVPYRITPDGDGGVVFLDAAAAGRQAGPRLTAAVQASPATTTKAKRITAAQVAAPDAAHTTPEVLAEGALTVTGLARGAGTVYVTGDTKQSAAKLPSVVRRLPGATKDAVVSTRGQSVLNRTAWADGKDSRTRSTDTSARPVALDLHVMGTDREAAFTVDPTAAPISSAAQGSSPSPALPQPRSAAPAAAKAAVGTSPGSAGEIVESDRSCSVPRNDPRNQAMQPKPRQVEWAVDQAVKGTLNVSRPANWKNLGMPAYQPMSLFPADALEGGGRIPAQIMLGVTAQESNMWQATRSALPGETGNPLIGNYYGLQLYDSDPGNDWDIDWSKADCGYGMTQVTDHMRLAGREGDKGGAAWDYQKQRAVSLDYTANLAAGMQILTGKWNQTRRAGMVINNGNSAKIENWFFALWAYNSGFYEQADAGNHAGKWGVGWANNPANPEWDESRNPFLEDSLGNNHYADAAHPQNWPYPEKVIGFAAHPVEGVESPGKTVAGFRAAWWNGGAGTALVPGTATYNRAHARPPIGAFCTADNNCDASKISTSATNSLGGGPCGLADFHCWWNKPVQWKNDCDYSCGNELVRFDSTYPEEADGTSYPPNCSTTGLPGGALIVDDVADDVPSIRPGCARTWSNSGTFTMDFGPGESVKDQNGNPTTGWPAKIDVHQLGGGFGGHFYFGHTRKGDTKGQRLKATGTWTLNKPLDSAASAAKVMVHLPDHGARTQDAYYEVKTPQGWVAVPPVNQRLQGGEGTNRWISLGAYQFSGSVPAVRLSTISPSGTGDDDIAFDAVAFVPGDYSDMPPISFPDDNPNAPEIDYDNQPMVPAAAPVFYALGNAPVPAGTRSSLTAVPGPVAAPPHCEAAQRPGTTLCLSLGQKKVVSPFMRGTGVPAAAAPSTAGSASAGSAVSCAASKSNFNRYVACLTNDTPVTAVLYKDRAPIGTATWNIYQKIQLYKNENSIDQSITIIPEKIDPSLVSVTLDWNAKCAGACSSGTQRWMGTPTWAPGDQHSVTAGVGQWWTGTTGASVLDLSWTFTAHSPVSTDTPTVMWTDSDMPVRCDVIMGREEVPETKPGCVFSKYTPTLTLNSAKRPAASALYWLLMEKLKTHPGSKKYNSPLHRQADETIAENNRKVICNSTFNPVPTGTSDKPSCDEYPFAKSRESGGGSLTSGAQCAQFYATKVGTRWQLKYDTSFPLPTWSEVCGRGSIPLSQNTGAGGELGRFTTAMRLHDNDAYFVDAPGFENCTPTRCDLP